MVKKGAIYSPNTLKSCRIKKKEEFCGIKEIDLSIPDELKEEIMSMADNKNKGKRVVIHGWKSGRTITTKDLIISMPRVWEWYKKICPFISSEIGEQVSITQDYLPTTCSILIYEDEGDFINWHYDANYFNGRFFTLIAPVTFYDNCTEYKYIDKDGTEQSIRNTQGKSILFEGNKIYHMASKFCKKLKPQKRLVLSMQFATDSQISWWNRVLLRIKDIAYIGI